MIDWKEFIKGLLGVVIFFGFVGAVWFWLTKNEIVVVPQPTQVAPAHTPKQLTCIRRINYEHKTVIGGLTAVLKSGYYSSYKLELTDGFRPWLETRLVAVKAEWSTVQRRISHGEDPCSFHQINLGEYISEYLEEDNAKAFNLPMLDRTVAEPAPEYF